MSDMLKTLKDVLHVERVSIDKPLSPAVKTYYRQNTDFEKVLDDAFWITCPEYSGVLSKRGTKWRKRWISRYTELRGRTLSYYCDKQERVVRGKITLSADALVYEMGELGFAVETMDCGSLPWQFSCTSVVEKQEWMECISKQIAILKWMRQYEIGSLLGQGSNGKVFSIVKVATNETFAVKVMKSSSDQGIAAIHAEVEMLRRATYDVKHEGVVPLYKVFQEQNTYYLVMQMCTGLELFDRILQYKTFAEPDAARLIKSILLTVNKLHRADIIHLDIKPENLLYLHESQDSPLLLADFGLSLHIPRGFVQGNDKPRGTVGYMAPETITSQYYTAKSDCFSIGVLLYILLVGYQPFNGQTNREVIRRTVRGEYSLIRRKWHAISPEAKHLVQRLLENDHLKRYDIEQALNDPWILKYT